LEVKPFKGSGFRVPGSEVEIKKREKINPERGTGNLEPKVKQT
jgi:hypothetical protein